MLRHTAAAVFFVALAIGWSAPLVAHLSTHLPGASIGDNATFLWNFWWMREALASHVDPFRTPDLFAPFGTDLTLNTHTALPAFVGATLGARLSPLSALNITTLAALALNGFCAYLLAWRATKDTAAAIVAGIVFACSPYIAARLQGHFNLTHAWVLPLFALACERGLRDGPGRWAVLAGGVLGLTTFIDYYYAIYELVLLACFAAIAVCTLHPTRPTGPTRPSGPSRPSRPARIVIAIAAVDLLLIVAVWVTGGFRIALGPLLISARDTFNLRQIFWALVVAAAWIGARPRWSITVRGAEARRVLTAAASIVAIAAGAASPLIWRAARLLASGDYASQQYYWRSSPRGIDLATLVLGHPFHALWGGTVMHAYAALGIDAMESSGWPSVVTVAMAVYAIRAGMRDRGSGIRGAGSGIRGAGCGSRGPGSGAAAGFAWLAIGVVFFVWSLGSHVFVAGYNTGFVMPAAFLQYVPILSNARMPGRAIVVVDLALAMLAATAVVEYRRAGGRAVGIAAVAALLVAELFIAPFPVTRVECPPIYAALRDRPEIGAVAELPIAIGDGLHAITPIDNRQMLACQLVHRRPLVGGFVARLSPRVLAQFDSDPLLQTWMRLSGASMPGEGREGRDGSTLSQAEGGRRLDADGIAFILLDRTTASAALRDHVEHGLPLTRVADDGSRALFIRTR